MSTEMSKAEGVEYIRKHLINGTLIMDIVTTRTGWSFPRVRSRAITICKKLGGTLEKVERGVYMFQPKEKSTPKKTKEINEGITLAEAEDALLSNLPKEG